MINDYIEEIVDEITSLEIDCPMCAYVDDPQYTCTICWGFGGNGKINVLDFIKEHKVYFESE